MIRGEGSSSRNVLTLTLHLDAASGFCCAFRGRKVVLVVVGEHVLFLLKAVFSGLIDKVPKIVREAQHAMAVQQREERKEFRRRARGLPVGWDLPRSSYCLLFWFDLDSHGGRLVGFRFSSHVAFVGFMGCSFRALFFSQHLIGFVPWEGG